MPEITELKIDRALWGEAKLLRPYNQKMCCLGHLGRACGISNKAMRDRGMPSSLSVLEFSLLPKAFQPLWIPDNFTDSDAAKKAAVINDDSDLPAAVKEAELIRLFAAYGITLSFYGQPTQHPLALPITPTVAPPEDPHGFTAFPALPGESAHD